ncbi:hypothetical protein I552_1964 [Mycobacterium xenopi 3993]|nr:hypothetical protein I552_1964 [Mycobacterium xenopi 3993]
MGPRPIEIAIQIVGRIRQQRYRAIGSRVDHLLFRRVVEPAVRTILTEEQTGGKPTAAMTDAVKRIRLRRARHQRIRAVIPAILLGWPGSDAPPTASVRSIDDVCSTVIR